MFALTFDPPSARRRLAFITMGRDGSMENRLHPDDLEKAEAVVDMLVAEPEFEGWILRSSTPGSFLEELDPSVLTQFRDRRLAESLSLRLHALLRRLVAADRPVIAAIDGRCLGVGLEAALCCRYRICTDVHHTRLGLPQILSGVIPAAGASFRLPRRVGLVTAAEMILGGKSLTAKQAHEIGLVDEVVGVEALDIAVRAVADRLIERTRTLEDARRMRWVAVMDNPLTRRRALRRLRASVRERTTGRRPAPILALDVLERVQGLGDVDAGRVEAAAFAELAMGEVSRALVAVRQATQTLVDPWRSETARRRVVSPPITRIGICGAGAMGADVAVAATESGLDVRIREANGNALQKALSRVARYWDAAARKRNEKVVFAARCRLSGGIDLEGFSTLDLILEAVPEDLELKRSVFAELERVVDKDAILATHTQALPVRSIVATVAHRHRVLGLHFFRPLHTMRLCEIATTEDTSSRTLETALSFVRRIGKVPIVVRDSPGFYATRLMVMYQLAAIEMLSEGYDVAEIDAGARCAGWPVGPLRLLDELGLDVAARVAAVLAQAFPDRARVPEIIAALLARGHGGKASGRGFYRYPTSGEPVPDPAVDVVAPRHRRRGSSTDEIGDRLTLVAALEAVRCLGSGVIASRRDGDVGAVLGIGYPAARGGPFRHLQQLGWSTLRGRLATLEDRFGARYAPPPELDDIECARLGVVL